MNFQNFPSIMLFLEASIQAIKTSEKIPYGVRQTESEHDVDRRHMYVPIDEA